MAQQRTGSAIKDQGADLDMWVRETLGELRETREMVEFWLKELAYYLEGGGRACEATKRDKAMCERTRMVLVAGETLHNLTSVFVRWSEQPVPASAWDPDLAARADRLLAAAASETRTSPYRENCAERLEYVRSMWPRWCPSLEAHPAATM